MSKKFENTIKSIKTAFPLHMREARDTNSIVDELHIGFAVVDREIVAYTYRGHPLPITLHTTCKNFKVLQRRAAAYGTVHKPLQKLGESGVDHRVRVEQRIVAYQLEKIWKTLTSHQKLSFLKETTP